MLEFAAEGDLDNVEKGNHIFYQYCKQDKKRLYESLQKWQR